MTESEGVLWFLGDLSDPWIESIAASLPASFHVLKRDCPDVLPEQPFPLDRTPRLIVLHRNRLTAIDAERLRGWIEPVSATKLDQFVPSDSIEPSTNSRPEVIVCASPYLRYEDLERWSGLIDQVVSEATAADVLPLRLGRLGRLSKRKPASADRLVGSLGIEILSGDEYLREMLVDACKTAGYRAWATDDRRVDTVAGESHLNSSLMQSERVLTLWDLPALEPGWPERLETRCRRLGPVIAFAGFANRVIVATAKSKGALACLDWPCDLDDLLDLVERTEISWPGQIRFDHAHDIPRASHSREQLGSSLGNVVPRRWPESTRSSTIGKDT